MVDSNFAVYTKLNKARMMMQGKGLKMNGVNDFAKYKFFELRDILPASNEICDAINATIYCQFDEKAHLFFVDCESGGVIEFTLPMSTANLKGCHEVQNLGAVQTYLKRYLYQNCYELSECDILDRTMNPNERPKAEPPKAKTEDASDKTKAEAELIVKQFEALSNEGFIKPSSLANMKLAYGNLKTEQEYMMFMANCKKNIQDAEKAKAESFNDDKIPF